MSETSSFPYSLSIIIPIFNAQDTLEELVTRLQKVLPSVCPGYEIILINDGSSDQSWDVIEKMSKNSQNVRGINLMRNYGQHNALLCGIRLAACDVSITMDDDLQHPPEEINKLLPPLLVGYDVVYGKPQKQRHALWRNLASYITRLALQSTMGVENARNVGAFRAIRTSIRDAFTNFQSPSVTLDVLLGWGTTRFTSVPVNHEPRRGGKSNYSFRRLVRHAIDMTTGFTILPLQLASMMGFGFAIFGLLILVYVIGRYLIQGGSVPGFPFLASIVAIFSGVQLFSLGIIGEYLARMHYRVMNKPSYVIREHTSEKTEIN